MSNGATASRRSADSATVAHRESVAEDLGSVIDYLIELLGASLVAYIAHVDDSTVRRWTSKGIPNLSHERERVLRSTHQIARMLLQHDASHTVRAWFIGMNPQMDDEAPAEALRDGRVRDAMICARAFLDGA